MKFKGNTIYNSEFNITHPKQEKLFGKEFPNSNLVKKNLPITIDMPLQILTQSMATFKPYVI